MAYRFIKEVGFALKDLHTRRCSQTQCCGLRRFLDGVTVVVLDVAGSKDGDIVSQMDNCRGR